VRQGFLEILAETGNVSRACRRLALNRTTAYEWRSDAEFASAWDRALELHRHLVREELIDKAMAATGHVLERPALDEDGQPLLDDDFEPVTYRQLVGHDPRIMVKLMEKFLDEPVRRVDQRTWVDGQVEHSIEGGAVVVIYGADGRRIDQPEAGEDDAIRDADFEEVADGD
jgi:hypothetical protein